MPENINIDQGDVSNYSSNIAKSASSIQVQSLSPIDNESTIAGNAASQKAFEESQNALSELITALESEAKKIKTLGDEFKSVDEQLAKTVGTISSSK